MLQPFSQLSIGQQEQIKASSKSIPFVCWKSLATTLALSFEGLLFAPILVLYIHFVVTSFMPMGGSQ